MFERRAYRRKSALNAWTVLLAVAALGLLFLVLRPAPDRTDRPDAEGATTEPVAAPANEASPADPGGTATPERPELSGLRHEVEKASQDLNALRSATAQMRAELSELRKQREALAGPAQGAPAAASASAPAQPGGQPISAAPANPVPIAPAAAVPAKPPSAPAASASTPVASAAGEASRAVDTGTGPAGAQAAVAGAEKPVAPADHAAKLPHHPHNAHGYLLTARDQLQSGDAAQAEAALERAETWALNNSGAYRDHLSPTDDPLVSTVEGVRSHLRAGHAAAALRMLEAILGKPRSADVQAVR